MHTVSRWLRQRRGTVKRGRRPIGARGAVALPVRPIKPWTGRQWAHFLGTGWHHLPRRATNALSRRLADDPRYRKAWTLTRHFQTLVAHRCGEATLAAWCRAAEASEIPDFVRFAQTFVPKFPEELVVPGDGGSCGDGRPPRVIGRQIFPHRRPITVHLLGNGRDG